MESVLSFIVAHSVVDFIIGLVGVFAIFLVFDRAKALYFDLVMDSDSFMKQVMNLITENKIDEAITLCSSYPKKPLAYVVKRVLERSDRDDHAIQKSLDIAASEVAPGLVKNLNHLPMISNVITLVGLFGTVIGLIVSFQALSFADPSQKQMVLANGISTAMSATALGLMVAIPVMFIYSFFYTKQSRLFSEIDQYSGKVVELLNDRAYVQFKSDSAYPTNLGGDRLNKTGKAIPPSGKKVV